MSNSGKWYYVPSIRCGAAHHRWKVEYRNSPPIGADRTYSPGYATAADAARAALYGTRNAMDSLHKMEADILRQFPEIATEKAEE